MKKCLGVAFILLFIGVLFAQSIHAKIQEGAIDEISTIIEENNNIGKNILKNSNEDCGCNDNNVWEFPIICSILDFLFEFVLLFSPFPIPLSCWIIILIAEILGCPNIP